MEIMHLFRHFRISRLITLPIPLTFTYLLVYIVQTPILVFTAAYEILSLKSRKELSIYHGGAGLLYKQQPRLCEGRMTFYLCDRNPS